ncbi:hypothetical protein niasHT_022125 [Heterodera trifolii]|uniref:Uncharacterized protein n=1 Tax=Heterodera trifolii TaxID=157864 RepID=A0ABD2K8Z6_9BILA
MLLIPLFLLVMAFMALLVVQCSSAAAGDVSPALANQEEKRVFSPDESGPLHNFGTVLDGRHKRSSMGRSRYSTGRNRNSRNRNSTGRNRNSRNRNWTGRNRNWTGRNRNSYGRNRNSNRRNRNSFGRGKQNPMAFPAADK